MIDTQRNHSCFWIASKNHCEKVNVEGFGPAIDSIDKFDDAGWWAGGGEYGSRIFYCPFCGEKLD